MDANRFLKTLFSLYIVLMVLVAGLDTALGRLAASPARSSFTLYDQSGETLVAYRGDLTLCDQFTHLSRSLRHRFQAQAS